MCCCWLPGCQVDPGFLFGVHKVLLAACWKIGGFWLFVAQHALPVLRKALFKFAIGVTCQQRPQKSLDVEIL